MKKLHIGLILLFGFNLISCNMSKELSREKAAEILSKGNYGYIEGAIPIAVEKAFQMGDGGGNTAEYASKAAQEIGEWFSATSSGLEKLKGEGFITYDVWQGPQGSRPPGTDPSQRGIQDYMYQWVQLKIHATDKLTPFIIASDGFNIKVRLIDMVFDKITGVTKASDNEAVVEFMLKSKATPLNGLVNVQANYDQQPNRSVRFRRYDDGWRLIQ